MPTFSKSTLWGLSSLGARWAGTCRNTPLPIRLVATTHYGYKYYYSGVKAGELQGLNHFRYARVHSIVWSRTQAFEVMLAALHPHTHAWNEKHPMVATVKATSFVCFLWGPIWSRVLRKFWSSSSTSLRHLKELSAT